MKSVIVIREQGTILGIYTHKNKVPKEYMENNNIQITLIDVNTKLK